MNDTSRSLLQTILATDLSLTGAERSAAQRLFEGNCEATGFAPIAVDEKLLVTQKQAAQMLGVSRVTIWRMTKECILHPVEILPGSWRYPLRELAQLAHSGLDPGADERQRRERSAA